MIKSVFCNLQRKIMFDWSSVSWIDNLTSTALLYSFKITLWLLHYSKAQRWYFLERGRPAVSFICKELKKKKMLSPNSHRNSQIAHKIGSKQGKFKVYLCPLKRLLTWKPSQHSGHRHREQQDACHKLLSTCVLCHAFALSLPECGGNMRVMLSEMLILRLWLPRPMGDMH